MKRWCTFRTKGCDENGMRVLMEYVKQKKINYTTTGDKLYLEIEGPWDGDIDETAYWITRLLWWK